MPGRKGPQLVHPSPFSSCLGCKHHDYRMLMSGEDPVYEGSCLHPDAPGASPLGVYIGRTDHTPHWCPYLNGSSNE